MAVTVDRPVLVTPGLAPPDPGVQTWWVRPGGATVVEVRPGDRLTVRDPHGGQLAELTVLDREGGEDACALDPAHPPDAPATVLRAALRDGAAAGFVRELHRRGLRPDAARAMRLFGRDSPAGATQAFTAQREATVVVAGPGEGRIVEGAWPASALTVEIRRAEPPPAPAADVELPPTLAEPRLDFRVDAASALSYEVREGEYIQIIDVRGRQCSDFLAFNAHKLQAGDERGIDAQVTRTLTGNAYPTVGLHSKYFDLDMDPLFQVVQDTVGRHDSFALACTSKYYEDLGYFGHRNCTENFNRQLDPFGVAPRKGWEAVNFFYNTAFDSELVMFLDEPWSRPDDYVLLRALSDLVCASSACPDDVDPSNGWVPTDVHVRVYSPENRFQMAIAHRVTPDAEPVMTKETAFHPR